MCNKAIVREHVHTYWKQCASTKTTAIVGNDLFNSVARFPKCSTFTGSLWLTLSKSIAMEIKNFMALFYGWGWTVWRLQSHSRGTVYFLPLSSQELPVLIWSTSRRCKAELALEPPRLLNPWPLNWESTAGTTRAVIHQYWLGIMWNSCNSLNTLKFLCLKLVFLNFDILTH